MNIAIVHDYLNQYGGAEKVVEVLHEVFPDAPIYTSIYLPQNLPESFQKMDIRTSFMQKLPFLKTHFKKYLMLYPKAIESFDLSGYDVVLSSSSAFAKGSGVGSETLHICYCYSPMRFVWNYESYIEKEEFGFVTRKILPFFVSRLKKWDLRTNGGVNHFIAISRSIQDRIWRCYQRDSEMIYPPVNVSGFEIEKEVSDYFLIVSRLNAYKRIDLVIEAFNRLGLPLKIIGDGPYRKNLERMARPNIEFLGKVPADVLAEKYSRCRALIFPGDEDFGIVPVEAQACGRPVIAYAAGGALETVIENVTGVFFRMPTADSLMEAISRFVHIESSFNPAQIRSNSFRFDEEIFKREIKRFIEKKYHEFQGSDK
jgi:glycosyltransferase involved in cell wall biosynthesis